MDLDCENGFKKIQTEIEYTPQVEYKLIYSQKLNNGYKSSNV